MENHHSVMVIGGLCKMDLNSIAQISLHRRLMAKQRNKNLLPLVADSSNREVRGCRHECEHRSALAAREGLGSGVHPGAHQLAFLLAPSCSPSHRRRSFLSPESVSKAPNLYVTLKKKNTRETTPKLKL